MNNASADGPQSFAHRIARLKQGEHLCSVYAEPADMLTQVVPYIKAGLLNGERCIYVVDENKQALIVHALKFWGVDADLELAKGQLVFWTRHEYRQPGPFDLDTMLTFVNGNLHQALLDGHTGIRLGVEMSWTINSGLSDKDLVRWEDFINTISFPNSKVSFLCQYNRRLLSADLIAKAVHVHPVVVLGQDICPNRYYRSATQILTTADYPDLDSLLKHINTPALHQASL